MIDASSCGSSIIIPNGECIRFLSQKTQLQNRLDEILGSVFQVIAVKHVLVQHDQIRVLDDFFNATDCCKIICLLCIVKIENRQQVPSWNHQCMPGIHRMGIEDPYKRPIFENERICFASRDFAKVAFFHCCICFVFRNSKTLQRKQIQTDLRLTGLELGLLLEFSAALMKDGVVRCVNALEEWRVHSWEKEISRRDAKAQRKKNKRRREKGGKYSTSSRD